MNLPLAVSTLAKEESGGLVIVGLALLVGFAAHVLGQRVRVPRVTLLLLIGFAVGPSVLDVVPDRVSSWFPLAAKLALGIIGFQLGERFLGKELRQTGKTVLVVAVFEGLAAAILVILAGTLVAWFCGPSLIFVVLLAAVAPASAPAATLDVIRESESSGPVTDTVLGVVAIDDAWGVILFSILVVVVGAIGGQGASASLILEGVWEVSGGILLGIAIGLPMAWLTGRVRPGELTLVESLGFVLLCSGLAIRFELSHILACMAMGGTVSNLASHHERPFHAIEDVEQPFLIVFFLLAGFEFDVAELESVGLIGSTYIVARSAGFVLGSRLGGFLADAPDEVRRYTGWCLLPQAGVALGLALIIAERHPDIGSRVLSIIVGTTIVFELLGPIVTRRALRAAGEVPEPS